MCQALGKKLFIQFSLKSHYTGSILSILHIIEQSNYSYMRPTASYKVLNAENPPFWILPEAK